MRWVIRSTWLRWVIIIFTSYSEIDSSGAMCGVGVWGGIVKVFDQPYTRLILEYTGRTHLSSLSFSILAISASFKLSSVS